MFTLEKRTALGPRTWGPSAKLTVSSANAWFKFFQFRGGRIAVDLWVFQDLHKGSRKDAEAASGNLVRPICCSSNILSSESIQTVACYHKTIFMVRCFFAVVLTWCWLRDDWKQVRHKFWSKNYTHIWSKKYIPENEHSNMWIKFQKTILVLNNDSFCLNIFLLFHGGFGLTRILNLDAVSALKVKRAAPLLK